MTDTAGVLAVALLVVTTLENPQYSAIGRLVKQILVQSDNDTATGQQDKDDGGPLHNTEPSLRG